MLVAALLGAALLLAGCGDGTRATPGVKATAGAATSRFDAGAAAVGATLPDDIARGLSTDAGVLDCEQGVVDGRSVFAADWVLAHRVDLDGDDHADWLVEGRHACLSGEGGADWWLYAGSGEGHRLLVAAGRARALELLATRSHGLPDLDLLRDGAGARYRYDGTAYVASGAATD